MKNLKKVLAFVVVFAMMLTCSVSAAIFPDVADTASYAEAATILSSLELMIGDDQGNFNPDKILTRAEATALIVRAKGLESAAAGAAGATQFNDVPATHWASGYVNLAAQSNIVNGYGDGNFGPEDEVKYEQFVKMVIAALDYEPKANLYGGYPSGYLIIASQKNVTKNVPGSAGQPVPRKTVAQILYNALNVGMMELVLDNQGRVEYHEGYDTLLNTYLFFDKYEGVVQNVSYTTDADGEVKVKVNSAWSPVAANDKVGGYYNEDGEWTRDVRNVSFDQADTNAETLRGYRVIAYVAEDAITGEEYIKAIAPKTGANQVVEIDYTQLAACSYDRSGALTAINYFADPADAVPTDVPVAATFAKIFNNGKTNRAEDVSEVVDFIKQADSEADALPVVAGKLTLINNGTDDEFDYAFVSVYGADDVVDKIDAVEGTIQGINTTDMVDLEEKNTIYTFIKNDEVVSFEDIAVGNVLSVQEGYNGYTIKTVYISDAVVEGVASEKRTAGDVEWFTVGTEEYQTKGDVDVKVGDEGKFFLNVDGKIVYTETVSAGLDNYAYLLDVAYNTQGLGAGAVEIKFLTAEGEWKVAQVADKVKVEFNKNDDRNGLKKSTAAGEFGIYDMVAGVDEEGRPTVELDFDVADQQLFQYDVNSAGKINLIRVAKNTKDDKYFSLDTASWDEEATYDANSNKLGNVYIGENTKIINIAPYGLGENDLAWNNEDRFTATSTSVLKDDEAYKFVAYDKDLEGYPAVVILNNADPGIDAATHPLVLTKVVDGTDEDGNQVTKFYGLQAGQEVLVNSVEGGLGQVAITYGPGIEAKLTEDWTLSAGDVVLFALDARGDIKALEVIMAAEIAYNSADNFTKSNGYNDFADTLTFSEAGETESGKAYTAKFGYASKTLSNSRAILNYADGSFEELTLRGRDICFYSVNINRITNVSVSNGSFSSIAASNRVNKPGSWVFVREYEEAPVAVVVYSYLNKYDVPTVSSKNAADYGALAEEAYGDFEEVEDEVEDEEVEDEE